MLLNMYTNNIMRISWNGTCSDVFVAKNGVKQGGVISPVLFCIYINGLLQLLCKTKVGCFIGNVFVGALAYADDLVLLAPTARAMRSMLHVCDQYATEYNMVFNACKSKCFVASRHKQLLAKCVKPVFYIGGKEIEYVEEWPHLGNLIHANGDDRKDITNKKNSLCGQINNVLCYFGKRDPITKLRLMRSYCSSLYGSVLWDLSNPCVEDVCVVWRKGLRRVWNIPHHTH